MDENRMDTAKSQGGPACCQPAQHLWQAVLGADAISSSMRLWLSKQRRHLEGVQLQPQHASGRLTSFIRAHSHEGPVCRCMCPLRLTRPRARARAATSPKEPSTKYQ